MILSAGEKDGMNSLLSLPKSRKTETGMLIVSMVGISVRKQAEEKRKQSEQSFRLLFENAVVGIFRCASRANFWMQTQPCVPCWHTTLSTN
jgi:PAS domain-containing protein